MFRTFTRLIDRVSPYLFHCVCMLACVCVSVFLRLCVFLCEVVFCTREAIFEYFSEDCSLCFSVRLGLKHQLTNKQIFSQLWISDQKKKIYLVIVEFFDLVMNVIDYVQTQSVVCFEL